VQNLMLVKMSLMRFNFSY